MDIDDQMTDVSNIPNINYLALEKSTEILIQKPDEFLASFPPQYFENETLIDDFKKIAIDPNRIGEPSGVGAVYVIPNQPVVLKVSHYCNNSKYELAQKQCRIATQGDLIFRIPHTNDNKMMVYAPNYFLEGLIGILLYNQSRLYTPAFMKIYAIQYDPSPPKKAGDPSKTTYMLSEKLESIDNYITDELTFLAFLFEILYGLDAAQKLGRYVHYDLHHNNTMARPKPSDVVNVYALDNGSYLYMLQDFESVIIDYGYNRYETKNTILSPRLVFQTGSGREQLDYYFFNPYYDVFTLLFMNLVKIQDQNFPNWDTSSVTMDYLLRLFLNISNDIPKKKVDDILDWIIINPNGWRPIPERLAFVDKEFRASGPYEMYNKIVNIIENYINAVNPPRGNRPDLVASFLKKYKLYVSDQVIDLEKYGLKMRHFSTVPYAKRMDTTYYKYENSEYKTFDNIVVTAQTGIPKGVRTTLMPFNHTYPQSVAKLGQFGKHVIHVATIDQQMGQNMGYEFNFDCCRIDLRNFFQTKKISSGIAINASFFRITDNYVPIGYYKTSNFYSNEPIPRDYKPFYGVVAITNNGLLKIDSYNNKNKYNNVISCGPLLIWDNGDVITDDIIANVYEQQNNSFIFQCRVAGPNEDPYVKVFSDNVRNCNQIMPGELSHSSNPNPRTALCITADNKVLFIYVEGRDVRGPGMDMSQLTQLCRFYGAVTAINLDGGRSSQFIWKAPGEQVIRMANPEQANAYPVGSIISYTKKM